MTSGPGLNTDILDLSSRMIDSGVLEDEPNRITNELSEIGDGVALVESFSHMVLVRTSDGLVAFDSSAAMTGNRVVRAMRSWSGEPVNTLVYTHGHVDHIGGSRSLRADAAERGDAPIRVVAQENLAVRVARYQQTNGYNQAINLRQFGGLPPSLARDDSRMANSFVPADTLLPTVEYRQELTEQIGGLTFEHHHALGETDDHTWTWIPEHRMITAGDHLTWVFPNCGNPQKVQRYPLEWAQSLRAMAAKEAELLVPAHGLPIVGRERIAGVLDVVAQVLEQLVDDVLAAMNTGATLDDIIGSVTVAPEALALPFLRPIYDEPEFVVNNIWRLYGGWWDGNPETLKPATRSAVAAEVVSLAGGADTLADRALALVESDTATDQDLRVACQLVEYAVAADPDSMRNHEIRMAVYTRRRKAERSLMAKGVFGAVVAESEIAVRGEATLKPTRITLSPED